MGHETEKKVRLWQPYDKLPHPDGARSRECSVYLCGPDKDALPTWNKEILNAIKRKNKTHGRGIDIFSPQLPQGIKRYEGKLFRWRQSALRSSIVTLCWIPGPIPFPDQTEASVYLYLWRIHHELFQHFPAFETGDGKILIIGMDACFAQLIESFKKDPLRDICKMVGTVHFSIEGVVDELFKFSPFSGP